MRRSVWLGLVLVAALTFYVGAHEPALPAGLESESMSGEPALPTGLGSGADWTVPVAMLVLLLPGAAEPQQVRGTRDRSPEFVRPGMDAPP